jgi:hypothetical protein
VAISSEDDRFLTVAAPEANSVPKVILWQDSEPARNFQEFLYQHEVRLLPSNKFDPNILGEDLGLDLEPCFLDYR